MSQHTNMGTSDLQCLSSMLNPKQEDEESDDDMIDSGTAGFTPASIGQPKKKPTNNEPAKVKDPNDIWDADEVPEITAFAEEDDGRAFPEYEISYQQSISSEDMFLNMSGKNPSSACCEKMVIKIHLPDAKIAQVDLDVKEKVLDCRTPTHKLILALPHPVDPKSGKAQWNGNTFMLSVTLTMRREYDFINFQ